MLLAEIHGKSYRGIEDLEDLLTSAVFGHLRLVQPPGFWSALLGRARTVDEPSRTLAQILSSVGIDAAKFSEVQVRFWGYFPGYGEPDLLVHLFGNNVASITILIEVKLHAGKSGIGEFDQLARYLALLNDPACLLGWPCDFDKRFLVYLTKNFSANELHASIAESKTLNAESRMFGLEWNDIAEIASEQRQCNKLLGEVADFLRRRGFERFHGFSFAPTPHTFAGHFYQRRYFEQVESRGIRTDGRFYGR
jgi:hypothetical protein